MGVVAEVRDSIQRIHGKYDLDSQITHSRLGHGLGMKSPTFRRYSSAGTDWAAWLLGIGLGLTLALQITTMRQSDINSVYAAVASVSPNGCKCA